MKLTLRREVFLPTATIGTLLVNGVPHCLVLEDVVREINGQTVAKWKVNGKTAIPVGTYKVVYTMSNRFKRMLPLLVGVAGFEGVRVHSGNKAEDTEGCPLVGTARAGDKIVNSKVALDALLKVLVPCFERGEPVTITVEGVPQCPK